MAFRSQIHVLLLSLPFALLPGCAYRTNLEPAPAAQTLPGESDSAVAASAGVRMVATPDTWSGNPESLARVVTPMRVQIENNSYEPLRVRYNEFKLVAPSGFSYQPLPPYKMEGSIAQPAAFAPGFVHSGFYVAPYYGPYFTGLNPWRHPWAWDSAYYDRYYSYWRVPLPTGDMLERAIPEGVLQPKGTVAGFLFFQKLDDNLERVAFEADLVSAQTGEQFGEISMPFAVE